MKKQISILGCGWLGFALAKQLISDGFEVKGSTTKPEKIALLEAENIQPFLIELNPSITGNGVEAFLETEILFVNIPPKVTLNGLDYHVQQIESLISSVPDSVKKVIFTSSTSVYDDLNREVFEADASAEAHPVLMKAEALMQQKFKENLVILRLAGLMGPNRFPAKYFAGKKGLTTGDLPVNYIHLDDLVQICTKLIGRNNITGIFNVVAPQHPKRQEVYTKNCQDLNLEEPEFVQAEPQDFKIVNGNKITQLLDYQFIYPNPVEFKYEKN